MSDFSEVEKQGEESGREEAADAFPFLPIISTFSEEEYRRLRRTLTRRGRARATYLYDLRGRAAHHFAQQWAGGFLANCDLFEDEEEEEVI